MEQDEREITELLRALSGGGAGALDELFEAVYGELRRLAHGQRRRWRGEETLNTTALLHEAYLKLSAGQRRRWEDRGHFFAVAAKAMRQILIDRARWSQADRRGGEGKLEALSRSAPPAVPPAAQEELLALDQALHRLEALDERQARVVECRFFGGLGVEETAEAVGVSTATVKRDWRAARAWLYYELTAGASPG
ncbi:MAG: ECF-type sigma factor [Thermoanaerobaculia bacterium]